MSGLRIVPKTSGLILEGELDIFSSPRLREELQKLSDETQPEVLVDLSRLGYIDSIGVEVLLSAQARLNSQKRILLVSGARGQVLRMFTLLKLERVLVRS